MAAVLPNIRSKLTAVTLAAVAVGAFPLISAAGPRTEIVPGAIPSVVVHYDDLNLADENDVRTLYRRIVVAARLICGDPDNRDLLGVTSARSCRRDAMTRAVQMVNNPRLAAVHAARGRQS